MLIKKRVIFVLFLLSCLLFSCKRADDYSQINARDPRFDIAPQNYKLDFTEMHNFVIESLQSEVTPFFYIVNGKFDISGDNDKKEIVVKCTCLERCVLQDVDLFFSYVLNLISINAAEQDSKFRAPSFDDEGTYLDFGSLFDTYSVRLFADKESGSVLRDTYVKNGEKIPIDPRYILN